jgi:hypothetical protein
VPLLTERSGERWNPRLPPSRQKGCADTLAGLAPILRAASAKGGFLKPGMGVAPASVTGAFN